MLHLLLKCQVKKISDNNERKNLFSFLSSTTLGISNKAKDSNYQSVCIINKRNRRWTKQTEHLFAEDTKNQFTFIMRRSRKKKYKFSKDEREFMKEKVDVCQKLVCVWICFTSPFFTSPKDPVTIMISFAMHNNEKKRVVIFDNAVAWSKQTELQRKAKCCC